VDHLKRYYVAPEKATPICYFSALRTFLILVNFYLKYEKKMEFGNYSGNAKIFVETKYLDKGIVSLTGKLSNICRIIATSIVGEYFKNKMSGLVSSAEY
uniref:Uncharacterized protein n=1 Tax=Romanomermis culicivorax TaxID=13658 RepID=A0A915KQ43_ROMCU